MVSVLGAQDPLIQKEGHHESGYLYCADDPTQGVGPPGPTRAQLDACGHEEGASFGTLFAVVIFLVSALYVGGGLAYGIRSGHGGSGVRAHPHYTRWEAIAGLVSDGAAYAKARAEEAPGGGAYVPLSSAGGERGSSRERPEKTERRESSGSRKKEKIQKKEKREKSAPAPAPAPAVSVEPVWKPTPRAAHLSSGARETGVKIQM